MAFDRDKLARLGSPNTNAPAIWSYTSADAIATVNTAGYFNNASKELKDVNNKLKQLKNEANEQ